jgi:hypothetical protein
VITAGFVFDAVAASTPPVCGAAPWDWTAVGTVALAILTLWVPIPLAPRTAQVVDLAVGERTEGPESSSGPVAVRRPDPGNIAVESARAVQLTGRGRMRLSGADM